MEGEFSFLVTHLCHHPTLYQRGRGVYLQNLGTLSAKIKVDTGARLYYL